jgi:hypothetical protein
MQGILVSEHRKAKRLAGIVVGLRHLTGKGAHAANVGCAFGD